MKEKKRNISLLTAVAILGILIIVLSITYSYFAAQAGGTTSTNATVTSNTTDLLTFSINRDISFTVTQNDFQENGTNQSGDATATATLTPNNKTGAATMNYYLYLNIEENPITYSEANTNGLPELMLQVFDGSNQLVTLSDLGSQVTIKGVTGYDITALEGPITLLDNHAISASNNTATIENWRIVITLINHDFNQNDNTGKEVSAEIIIQKEELVNSSPYVYWNDNYEEFAYYDINSIPDGEGLYGVYNSQEELANAMDLAYLNSTSDFSFSEAPIYIKSSIVNGSVISHEACVFENNHEMCISQNYWIGNAQDDIDGSATLEKLIDDLEDTLDITIDPNDCKSREYRPNFIGYATCDFASWGVVVHSDGAVVFSATESTSCGVAGDGSASCTNTSR